MATQDDFEATVEFKISILLFAQQNWSGIAGHLNETYNLRSPLKQDDSAAYHFFLALLFIQSRAPYNIYDQAQGDRIWNYIINMFTINNGFGSAVVEILGKYEKIWKSSLADGFNPVDYIVQFFLLQIGSPEYEDVILGTAISGCIAVAPPWWKNFSDKNTITRSTIPQDLNEFKEFAKEAEKTRE